MLVIDPDECMSYFYCTNRSARCNKIGDDLTDDEQDFIQINAEQPKWPVIDEMKEPLPDADEWKKSGK